MFIRVLPLQLLDVGKLPLDGWHIAQGFHRKQSPVRLALLEAEEQGPVFIRQPCVNLLNQSFPGGFKIVIGEWLNGHTRKLRLECVKLILEIGTQEFMDWSGMAQQRGEKALTDVIRKTFMSKKLMDIEQVARMLPVERRA